MTRPYRSVGGALFALPLAGFVLAALVIAGQAAPPLHLPRAVQIGPGAAAPSPAAVVSPAAATPAATPARKPSPAASARPAPEPRDSPAPVTIVPGEHPVVVEDGGAGGSGSPTPERSASGGDSGDSGRGGDG